MSHTKFEICNRITQIFRFSSCRRISVRQGDGGPVVKCCGKPANLRFSGFFVLWIKSMGSFLVVLYSLHFRFSLFECAFAKQINECLKCVAMLFLNQSSWSLRRERKSTRTEVSTVLVVTPVKRTRYRQNVQMLPFVLHAVPSVSTDHYAWTGTKNMTRSTRTSARVLLQWESKEPSEFWVAFDFTESECESNCHGLASDSCKSNTISPIYPSNPSQKWNQLRRQLGIWDSRSDSVNRTLPWLRHLFTSQLM